MTTRRNHNYIITDRPLLPPQPNTVFDIGVAAGADKFLQTITPRSAIVSSVSTADNFLSLWGQSANLSEIDLGCVDLIDLLRVGAKVKHHHVVGLAPVSSGQRFNFLNLCSSPTLQLHCSLRCVSASFLSLHVLECCIHFRCLFLSTLRKGSPAWSSYEAKRS